MDIALELYEVSKYYGARRVIETINLCISRGEFVCLLGSNGAGKSTLLRLMSGLIRPTHGVVRLFDVPSHGKTSYYRRLGILIERADLYPFFTAEEHIRMIMRLRGLQPSHRRIDELLDCVGLLDVRDQTVHTYSAGMKQRLGIALALIEDPDVLILDEPLTSLDPIGIGQIRNLLSGLHRNGTTIIMSSHLLANVENISQRLVLIHEGRLIADGPTSELLMRAQRQFIIETAQEAECVVSLLQEQYEVETLTYNSITVHAPAEQIPMLIEQLISRGIRVQAVIPLRSLEQFYFQQIEHAQ